MNYRRILAIALFISTTTVVFGAPVPATNPAADNGGYPIVDRGDGQQIAGARIAHQRNPKTSIARQPISRDVGEIAVLVDNGAMILQPRPANPIDLSNRSFRLTPVSGGFTLNVSGQPLDPVTGSTLPEGDDTAIAVPLPFSFPFLGSSYTTMFVSSDGNITFGQPDGDTGDRNAARLVSGPPRIAALLVDLDVTSGGSIKADIRVDRAVVTWTSVPEFGTTRLNTFQITLHADGAIDLVYGALAASTDVDTPAVGVAAGNNSEPFNVIDFSATVNATYQAGAIFEEFYPARLQKEVDQVEVAKEFFRTHPDHFDFLVMFTNFEVVLPGGPGIFASNVTWQNRTRGIGRTIFDSSAELGSAGEFESFLFMNNINVFWPDERKLVDPPIDMFRFSTAASIAGPPGSNHLSFRARRMGTRPGQGTYSLGLYSPMAIMAHETFHRWAAFVPFVHPTKGIGPDSLDLIEGAGHWSFFLNNRVPAAQFGGDPRSSSLQGNAIVDFGGNFGVCPSGQTFFRTERDELTDGFSELDQYLMGVRRQSEVSPFWYIDNPTRPGTGASLESIRAAFPIDDFPICGNRVNLTVANIQAFPGVGPRIPAIGDEDDDGQGNDVKTQAFILLVENDSPSANTAAINQVDNFRRVWQQYANGPATGGRGKFDTSLHPVVH